MMTSRQAYQLLGISSTESLEKIEATYRTRLQQCQRLLLLGNSLPVRQQAQREIIQLENAICCIRMSGGKTKQQTKSTSQPLHSTATPQASFNRKSSWLYDLLPLFAMNGHACFIGVVIVLIIMGFLVVACVKGCSLQESLRESTLKSVFSNKQHSRTIQKSSYKPSVNFERRSLWD